MTISLNDEEAKFPEHEQQGSDDRKKSRSRTGSIQENQKTQPRETAQSETADQQFKERGMSSSKDQSELTKEEKQESSGGKSGSRTGSIKELQNGESCQTTQDKTEPLIDQPKPAREERQGTNENNSRSRGER